MFQPHAYGHIFPQNFINRNGNLFKFAHFLSLLPGWRGRQSPHEAGMRTREEHLPKPKNFGSHFS
jgi:methionyl-tRNA formyltransferase